MVTKTDNKGVSAGWRQCSKPLNNDFGQVFVQNETRNQNGPIHKNLFKVTNKALVQGMKIVKRYQQRHQKDVKTIL